MPRVISALAAAPIVFVAAASDAQNQSCSCPSGPRVASESGGNGAPLNWKFEAYEVSPGNAGQDRIICYFREVENKSASEVTDIWWEVAGYKRDFIPAHTSRPSCGNFVGQMKPSPETGPLHYGISANDKYDTIVHPPQSGWYPKAAASSAEFKFEPLHAEFVLDARSTTGKPYTSLIRIVSSAEYDGKVGHIYLEVMNNGEGPVGVYLNIPSTPQFSSEVPITDKTLYILPGKWVKYSAKVELRPEVTPASVVLYSEDGRVAALETAGFYAPSGGKPRKSDAELWGSHRQDRR